MRFTARARPGLQRPGEAELYLDARTGAFRYVTDTADAALAGTGGGGGVTDHAALTSLPWASSGHTGTASRLAGFSGAGAAAYYAIGSDVQAWSATLDTVTAGTYTGSTSITTLGTVATGTWSATAIGPTKGGTGLTSYAEGDTLYASDTNTLAKLAAPAAGARNGLTLGWTGDTLGWVALGVASAIQLSGGTDTPLPADASFVDAADGNAEAFLSFQVP